MAYDIRQWPASIRKTAIGKLPGDAEAAVLVMLRAMRLRGPWLEEYTIKPLPRHLHGLNQVNMKVNGEQIRVLFSVYRWCIVVFHVFKKTSPAMEQRAYETALNRKKTAEQILAGGKNELPTVH
jgi:phage-related protein